MALPGRRVEQEVKPTEEELKRIAAARDFVHAATCPGGRFAGPCAACPTATGVWRALQVLDVRPRDAKAARRALHDVVCRSGCGTDSDHADRTQAQAAAALRKFRAQETVR